MTKSINHWYPRYPADYGKKTRHLSMMEHGAYALLMDYCYSTGNPIPANAVQVHRICMAFASDEQDACMRVLHEFFTEQPDGWHNDRIDEELEKRNDISDKRSKAAQKRYEKKPANAHAIAPANADTATATANIDKKERAKALLSSGDDAPDQIKIAFDAYNEFADRFGLGQAKVLSPKRRSAIRKRMAEAGGLDGWKTAIEKAAKSDFLTGKRPTKDGPFVADLDFILQQTSFTRLMEGFYDNRNESGNRNTTRGTHSNGNRHPGGIVGAAMRIIADENNRDQGRRDSQGWNDNARDVSPAPVDPSFDIF